MNFRKIKHDIYLKKEVILGNIDYLFSQKKSQKIRIVSSKKWAYKCGEDVLILRELKKKGYNAKIICYEEEIVNPENVYLIKSIWGYQDNQKRFKKFLSNIENNKTTIINPTAIIKNNINKEEQYRLFINYSIPHINSVFINKDKDFLANIKKTLKKNFTGKIVVVKPSISASGNNTYVLNGTDVNNIKLNELEEKFSFLKGKNKLIIQEYIPEVKDGEVSVICLNGQIIYAVKRYPCVFTKKNTITLLDNIDKKIVEITINILNIPELKKAFYARIDLIRREDFYLVMEIEYTDPQLFLNIGCSKQKVKEHVSRYIDELTKYLEKNDKKDS